VRVSRSDQQQVSLVEPLGVRLKMGGLQQLTIAYRHINTHGTIEYELIKPEVTYPKSGCHEVPRGVNVRTAVIAELENKQVGNIPSLDTVMVQHLHSGNPGRQWRVDTQTMRKFEIHCTSFSIRETGEPQANPCLPT
jgi:hypothetical protein